MFIYVTKDMYGNDKLKTMSIALKAVPGLTSKNKFISTNHKRFNGRR
jgi:hypothetical protein